MSSMRSSSPPERYALALASSSSGTGSSTIRPTSARIASIAAGSCAGSTPAEISSAPESAYSIDARADVVGQALLLAHAEEQAARHPVAQHGVEHRQRPAVGVVPAQRGHGDRELRLRRVAAPGEHPRAGGQRGRGFVGRQHAVARPERLRRQLDRLVVLEVAGDRHDRVRRPVHRAPEVADRGRRQRSDARLVAADLAAQRPVAEQGLLDQHLDVLGRVVEVRADLLDDDRPLLVDVGVLEARVDDQLAQHVHRGRGLAAGHARPVDGGLAIGRGVRRPADALDGLGDRARRRVAVGALEREVLHEVGDAGLVGRLEARAGEHVRGDRHRARARQPGGDDARPSGSLVRSNISADGSPSHRRPQTAHPRPATTPTSTLRLDPGGCWSL